MRVLIIEDETPAAEKLERYLIKYDPNNQIIEKLDSVKSSITWLANNQDVIDLIFMDIQLIDGLSFEIFDEVRITKPIIFTTAFNDYAIDAFKVSSIDYLLKPVTFDDLSESLKKLESLRKNLAAATGDERIEDLNKVLANLHQKSHKTRFMVKLGEHIRSITVDRIALFFAEGRTVTLLTTDKRKFIVDYKMEDLESLLDPTLFNRVNRTFIVNINAISDVLVYSNSRLKVSTHPEFDKEIIVSREKVPQFKEWFNGLE
ncbi:MAG: LytTR family DNA-binding domain-containing protein [Bacteroidota bacterium]